MGAPTVRAPNSWSPSCPVTLPVCSAPSFLIQLTPWFPSSTGEVKPRVQWDPKLRKFMERSVSTDSGKVSEPEFSWLVPLPACNGSSTIPSRSGADSPPLEESDHFSNRLNYI